MLFHRKPWIFSLWAVSLLLIMLVTKSWFPPDFREQITILIIFVILFISVYISVKKPPMHSGNFYYRIIPKYLAILFQFFLILLWSYILTLLDFFYYKQFLIDALFLSPAILLFLWFYTIFADKCLEVPEDEYYYFGLSLTKGCLDICKKQKIFLIKTTVKIIFIPFMYGHLIDALGYLFNSLEKAITIDEISLIFFNFGLTADLLIASFGYFFSSRLLNNHIVDTDKNLLGWLFCLLCYPPLNWIMGKVNNQQDYLIWTDIFSPDSILYWIWFILINSSWIIYWLATAAFGMGFANLSYRRLIDNGVYRYSKHPAYLAKNIYWWLYTLPFFGVGLSLELLQNILGLTFVSLVYYGRAKSEEKHLLQFPEYREYSRYIEKYGLLSKFHTTIVKYLSIAKLKS